MIRFANLVLPVLLVTTACNDPTGSDITRVLPTADQLAVKLPTQSGQPVALGAIAETYVWTRNATEGLNGLTAVVLFTVHAIAETRPTAIVGSTYVWGPGSDALDPAEWMLTVTDLGGDDYDWQLRARRKGESGEFAVVIDGHAHSGSTDSGSFLFDLDALHAADPIKNPDAQGSATFEYSVTEGGPSMVKIDVTGNTVANYRYDEAADGSGSFQFSFSEDIDHGSSAAETARIRARWMATGAGRADVTATGGDLESQTITFSQCWNPSFKSVFEDFDLSSGQSATAGEAAECAFTDLDLPDASPAP